MNRENCFTAHAICAAITLPGNDQLPDSIQWMPPGRHTLSPSVEGKATKMTIEVTAALAERFNQQLQDLRADAASGVEDEPYIDFNHEDRERAAEVLELYWGGEDPKAGGIRARVKWSDAGKAAVLGRNYRRFSPAWGFDKKTFDPVNILTNLGGLVNRAAFREIAPVIAKNAGAATHNKTHKMTEQEIQDAISNGITRAMSPFNTRLAALETNPAGGGNGRAAARENNTPDIGAQIANAMRDGLKPLIERFETAEKNMLRANASAAIRPHIEREAIAPADTDTIKFWEDAWIANAKHAEAQLAKLPGKKPQRLLTATARSEANHAPDEPDEEMMMAAAKMVEAGQGKVTMADALIAHCRTVGQGAYKEFRSTFVQKPNKEQRN